MILKLELHVEVKSLNGADASAVKEGLQWELRRSLKLLTSEPFANTTSRLHKYWKDSGYFVEDYQKPLLHVASWAQGLRSEFKGDILEPEEVLERMRTNS